MSSSKSQRAVLGSSFAGLTPALKVGEHHDDGHEVVVVEPRDLAHGLHPGREEPTVRVMSGPRAHSAKLASDRSFIASRMVGV